MDLLLLTSIFNQFLLQCFASNLFSRTQDTNGLLNIEHAVSVEIHGAQEGMQNIVGNVHALRLAILALGLKLVADLAKSVEVDPAFLDDALHDLVLLAQEILEGAVLVEIAASLFGFLMLVEVQHVIRNLVEWDVVYVQGLGHVESSDVVVVVPLVLVELVVPE